MTFLCLIRNFVCTVAISSITVWVSANSLCVAQDNEKLANVQYVPQSAFAAAVMYPQKTLMAKENELLPREIIQAFVKSETGIDPLEVKQFIGLLVETGDETLPIMPAMIIRCSEPPQLSEKLLRRMKKETLKGKIIYRGEHPQEPAFYFVEDKTLLVAPSVVIEEMAEAQNVDTPLTKLLASENPANQITVFVAVDQIKRLIELQLEKVGPIPAPFSAFAEIPQHLQSLELTTDMANGGSSARIIMTAYDEKSAVRLQEILNGGMGLAKGLIISQMRNELDDPRDPLKSATFQYVTRVADRIEEMLRPQREGKRLEIIAQNDFATSGVLVALLLPAVQAAREAARRTQAANDLKQIMIAFHYYHQANQIFPASANYDLNGKPLLSWRVHILPYLDQQDLYDQFHLDEAWDSPHNKTLIEKMPEVFHNPNLPRDTKTNFLVVTGAGTVFDGNKGLKIAQIRDGTSNTIMVVEADADEAVTWTKPSDWQFDPQSPRQGLGNLRPGIFQAAFADGSVQAISNALDLETLRAMFTRAGGEEIRR